MSDLFVAGFGFGLLLGMALLLVCNETWYRRAQRQNDEWYEIACNLNEEWAEWHARPVPQEENDGLPR